VSTRGSIGASEATGRSIGASEATGRSIVIVGNGMVGSRLAEELRHRQPDPDRLAITVFGAEPHDAYNRILLSTVVAGKLTADQTLLHAPAWWEARGITTRTGEPVRTIDSTARVVHTDRGDGTPYDELVLATGSRPFVPPIEGLRRADGSLAEGAHAFRTLEDCSAIIEAAGVGDRVVVLGGGLLGLETARGLAMRGASVTVVHPKPFPMDRQLDHDAGAVLGRLLEELDVTLRLGHRATGYRSGKSSRAVLLDDDSALPCDVLVISAGVVADTALGRSGGVAVGRGFIVDDQLRTNVAHVSAVGECAEHRGTTCGLVAPGWEQAAVLADRLTGADELARYTGTPDITRLKAHGIDLASMGDVHVSMHDRAHEVTTFADPAAGRYAKLVVREGRVAGAILLGCPEVVGTLTQIFEAGLPVPADRVALLTGASTEVGHTPEPSTIPSSAVVCRCNSVTMGSLTKAWQAGHRTVSAMADATRATTGCGGCTSAIDGICGWLSTVDPEQSVTTDGPRHLSAIAG